MTLIPRSVLLIVAAFLLFGCTTAFRQLEDSSRPFEIRGYSVLPPGKWAYMEAGFPQAGVRFRSQPSATHTRVASVIDVSARVDSRDGPAVFLESVRRHLAIQCAGRQTCLRSEVLPDPRFGSLSVRYSFDMIDRAASTAAGKMELPLRSRGFVFVHPQMWNVVLEVHYSERGLPGEMDDEFIKQGFEKFVGGVSLRTAAVAR